MKKPKISNCEWHPVEYCGYYLIHDEPYYGASDLLNEECTILAKNNAKAIAQVPNMIDELIDAYYVLKAQVDSWGERRKQHDMYANMKSIEQTLLNAGCEL